MSTNKFNDTSPNRGSNMLAVAVAAVMFGVLGFTGGFFYGNSVGGDSKDVPKPDVEVTDMVRELPKAKGTPLYDPESGEAQLVIAPASRIVTTGTAYEADIIVVNAPKGAEVQFTGSGAMSRVGPNHARIKVTAPGGFAKGTNIKEASYSVRAVFEHQDGTVELSANGSYLVSKPVVQVSSASIQNLYYKCGNTVHVDVPALGDLYNPVIKASSAEVLRSKSDKRKFTLVPSGKSCVVNVSSNTNGQQIKIDDIKYMVIKPPRPRIEVMVNNKLYNGMSPISKKSNLRLRVVPNSDFKAMMPKDARYMLSNVKLLSQRSLGAPSQVGTFSGSGKDAAKGIPIALGNKLKQDAPGTKIYLKVDKIYRVNFKNQKIQEKFNDAELAQGLIIK